MLRKIDRIILKVPNVESAVRYYRDVFGLRLVRQESRLASLKMADGETEFILHADDGLPDFAVYHLVDDVREMYRRRRELKLTFGSPPASVSSGWRATVRDPFGNVLQLIDRMGGQHDVIENAKPPGTLFAGIESRVRCKGAALSRLYEEIGRTADDLPYTPHFEKLHADYAAQFDDPKPSRGETWRHLLNLRKGGKLPKLGEARSPAPPVPPEARERLREALKADLGRRDRLPYTDRFEKVVDDFNSTLPRHLSPHQVWRLVATIAK